MADRGREPKGGRHSVPDRGTEAGGARAPKHGVPHRGPGRRADLASSVALLLLATVVVVDSRGYPPSLVPEAPGPAFFPRLLAAAFAVCAVMLVWPWLVRRPWREGTTGRGAAAELSASAEEPGREARGPDGGAEESAGEPHEGKPAGGWRLVLVAVGLVAGFVALVPRSDTFLLLPPLIAGLMALMGERRPLALVAIPVLFDVFIYVVFFQAFGVPLPTILFAP